MKNCAFFCSAVLAHVMLNEKLNPFGMLGCILCISGSVTIVLHAPEEREISSLLQVWRMALQPGDPSLSCIRDTNRSHFADLIGLIQDDALQSDLHKHQCMCCSRMLGQAWTYKDWRLDLGKRLVSGSS